MNWSTIESGWRDYQANAQTQWSKLSPDQIQNTRGKREDLSSQVQHAYAVTKEEAERQISAWQSKQMEKQAPAAKS